MGYWWISTEQLEMIGRHQQFQFYYSMEPTSGNKKRKAVNQSMVVPIKKSRKGSTEFLPKINKQTSRNSVLVQQQITQKNSNQIQHNQHSQLNSMNHLTNREVEQLNNNQFMETHDRSGKKEGNQHRYNTEIPEGLTQQKYGLPGSLHQQKRDIINTFKKQLINRDQYEHPFKYKIVNEQLGFNPERIYKLKQAELSLIQEQYQKNKGIEYLRESKKNARLKTEEIPQTANKLRSNLNSQVRSRTKSEKIFKGKKAVLDDLREKEDIMGKIVYQRVKRHLKQEKVSNDFNQRVHSQEAIDRALIDFLKLKIERAETSLKRV